MSMLATLSVLETHNPKMTRQLDPLYEPISGIHTLFLVQDIDTACHSPAKIFRKAL